MTAKTREVIYVLLLAISGITVLYILTQWIK